MIELGGLINAILGFGSAIAKDKLQRHELVIKLLKQLHLDPEHPPADFTAVYQYALVEYGIGKPKPVLEIFRQSEIQQIFRRALDQNNPAILLKEGEEFLAGHVLGDELQALGMSARREFYEFAAVFIEIAKRTRTPSEVLTNQRLESLHRQIGIMQERLNRLPTLEGIRTEMARLAEQDLLALPSTEASTVKQCRAFALAQQMRGWFETLGYRFEKYEVWEDDYFEWVINVPVRRNRFDLILVRGIEGEAGLGDVRLLRQSVETRQADEGWLVTARRISRAARDEIEKPENRHLDCYTFDELVDLDADFSGYIEWLEAEIQRRGIETAYVPLACTKEELDSVTRQRLTVSRYDERDGWIDGYIDRWLDDSAKEHISVLGEFGTGKTWFAFHYAWVALQRYQEAKERGTQRPRLPLVITLRDYAKALNVENVLAGFFFTQHNIRLNSEVFDQLNRMGKLLLIFDGFDEMAAKVDKQQMINNFWELAKVVVPGAKVILTCRTEHFPEAQEGRALLNAELQASTANLTGETPQFEVLELEKFADDQIRQVLSFQATSETVEQVMGNPQLLDLARRPVMTELILEALPDIEAGKPVDMSRVYLYAVRRKMERDIKAERTFTSLADKLYFLCELSWEMLSTDQMSLNYRLFPDRIRKLFGAMVQEEKDLDHWHYDMMGQTMLIRNADGDYAPAHRSLIEFFVAYKFAAELGALGPDFLELAQIQTGIDEGAEPQEYRWSEYFQRQVNSEDSILKIAPLQSFKKESLKILRTVFGQSPLTKAVIDLLAPMLDKGSACLELLGEIRGKTEDEVGYIGGNAATLLVSIDQTALEDKDLSHVVIRGANFTNASLHGTSFVEANLTDSIFSKLFGAVASIAFSPDSALVAIGDSNGLIQLWIVDKRREFLTLEGHTNWINDVTFSPDGELLASASADDTVRIWNVQSGECLKVLSEHKSPVNSVAFHPDGELLASASNDNSVILWSVQSGKCLNTLQDHLKPVNSIAFSPDGELLASASSDNSVILWNASTGKVVRILQGHTNPLSSVAFSPDGKILASGSADQTIRYWDSHTGECLRILQQEPNNQVMELAFSPDGKILASGGMDGNRISVRQTVKLWDAKTGKCLRTLKGHIYAVRSVAFSPNSQILASAGEDQTVHFWDISTGKCMATLQGYESRASSIDFNYDGKLLASASKNQVVRIWDTGTQKCTKTLLGHSSRVLSVTFSPDGQTIASGSSDQTVRLWNTHTGKCIKTLQGHTNLVWSVTFSPDGKVLASSGFDKVVRLWDVQSGQCLNILREHEARVYTTKFSPDGKVLASGGFDKVVRLWDVQSSQCLNILQGHEDAVWSIAFSPNGHILASGSRDSTIRIWDVSAKVCLQTFRGHSAWVWSIAFSPDGQFLSSGSADKTIKLWNISTGECVKTFRDHTNSVRSIAFSPDGKVLASGSSDQTIKLWSTKTNECFATLSDRPYENMNITGVEGLTEAEKATLKALGAIEN